MIEKDPEVKSALTPEALDHLGWYLKRPVWTSVDWDSLTREWGPHVTAALALYGQPFGFTHEHVRALREYADSHGGVTGEAAIFAAIADRIAALLPPE